MSVKRESIAIVGIGGIFPQSPTIDAFWDNISKGVNTAREIPDGRWPIPVETAYTVEKGKLDRAYSKKACFIEDFKPDFKGLNIDPRFAAGLDPAFHLLLHAGGQAFNEGKTSKLNREKVGVIIGNLVLPSEKSSELAYELLGRKIEKEVLRDKFIDTPKSVDPINRFSAGLPAGIYYFAVTAFNATDESPKSNEVSGLVGPTSCADLNNDNAVNILDLQLLINVIIGKTSSFPQCDVNKDGRVDILDAQLLILIYLGLRSCPG